MDKKAVIILSGGLDSATILAMAAANGYECYALTFDYGQRLKLEIAASKKLSKMFCVKEHKIFKLDLNEFKGSALTDPSIEVPIDHSTNEIPITYVPARNTVFLSIALAWAEVLKAIDIFIGVNAVDYSGYPDCRPEYIDAFSKMANFATKFGIESGGINIQTPLINLSKSQIIELGLELGIDYSITLSCYQPDQNGAACRVCSSCIQRKEGFLHLGVKDPTVYRLQDV